MNEDIDSTPSAGTNPDGAPAKSKSKVLARPATSLVGPHRIRTYLVFLALALLLPLLAVALIAFRMAAIEEAQIENRIVQIAENLTVAVDQELDRALITLETLATSSELRNGDLRGFHDQAVLALKPEKAAIVAVSADEAIRMAGEEVQTSC